MKTLEEISKKIRTSPDNLFDIIKSDINGLLSTNEDESLKSLKEVNTKLYDYVKKSLEPLEIIKTEVNNMKLISSKKLLVSLKELEDIIEFTNDETLKDLEKIATKPDEYYNKMQLLMESPKVRRLKILFEEILQRMRKEINIKD